MNLLSGGEQIVVRLECAGSEVSFSMPKTKIAKPKRSISVADLFTWLKGSKIQGFDLADCITDNEGYLITRKSANQVADRISGFLHKSKKKKSAVVRIELPEEIKQKLAVNERNDRNNIQMCR
ncbi:MAG: hypothetical protein ACYTFY_06400, partial [Planctomycetota bacterium]